jgi:uncharacterized protein (DUF433 family)
MGRAAELATEPAYAHIQKRDGVCGGKSSIDNTRIRVNNVVWLHKHGYAPEQIIIEYPDLSLAQVYAALAYYYDHRAEIEAELAADEGAAERFEQAKAEFLKSRATK